MVSEVESFEMADPAACSGGTHCVEGAWRVVLEYRIFSMDVSIDAGEYFNP